MTQFFILRQKILSQPTIRQTQMARSIASANTNNNPSEDSTTTMVCQNVAHLRERFFIHYTHEKRFRHFKRDMHQLYQNVFQDTPAMTVKMVVGNRNRRDNRQELIHKRPKQFLLSNKYKEIKRLKFRSKYYNIKIKSRKDGCC